MERMKKIKLETNWFYLFILDLIIRYSAGLYLIKEISHNETLLQIKIFVILPIIISVWMVWPAIKLLTKIVGIPLIHLAKKADKLTDKEEKAKGKKKRELQKQIRNIIILEIIWVMFWAIILIQSFSGAMK